jgi:DNA-binding CsgD family transcriptional regulator
VKTKTSDARLRQRLSYLSNPSTEVLRKKLKQPISPRELQVLTALGKGETTREIRLKLNISGKTVGVYIERLKKKLEVSTLNELICVAALLREGIIPSEPSKPNGRSLRVCPNCQKLFSIKRPKKATPELVGYRVLSAVLRQNCGEPAVATHSHVKR